MTRKFSLAPQSNAADLLVTANIKDEATDPPSAYDLTGMTVKIDLVGQQCGRALEAASPSTMIDLSDAVNGNIGIAIPASSLRSLSPGSYELGIVLVNGAETSNPIIATVPIFAGHPK